MGVTPPVRFAPLERCEKLQAQLLQVRLHDDPEEFRPGSLEPWEELGHLESERWWVGPQMDKGITAERVDGSLVSTPHFVVIWDSILEHHTKWFSLELKKQW